MPDPCPAPLTAHVPRVPRVLPGFLALQCLCPGRGGRALLRGDALQHPGHRGRLFLRCAHGQQVERGTRGAAGCRGVPGVSPTCPRAPRTVQSTELPALEEACATFARARHRFERLEATRQQLAELLQVRPPPQCPHPRMGHGRPPWGHWDPPGWGHQSGCCSSAPVSPLLGVTCTTVTALVLHPSTASPPPQCHPSNVTKPTITHLTVVPPQHNAFQLQQLEEVTSPVATVYR